MTQAERHLAYAKAQVNHPDPQLRPLLALIYGSDLPRLQTMVDPEKPKKEADSAP